nr:hypothetical protein [Gluconobacter wancherniae]
MSNVRCNTKGMTAVGCDFMTTGAHWADPIEFHQTPYITFADIELGLFELHDHPRATIDGVAQDKMFPDMRQCLQVDELAQAHPLYLPSPITTR